MSLFDDEEDMEMFGFEKPPPPQAPSANGNGGGNNGGNEFDDIGDIGMPPPPKPPSLVDLVDEEDEFSGSMDAHQMNLPNLSKPPPPSQNPYNGAYAPTLDAYSGAYAPQVDTPNGDMENGVAPPPVNRANQPSFEEGDSTANLYDDQLPDLPDISTPGNDMDDDTDAAEQMRLMSNLAAEQNSSFDPDSSGTTTTTASSNINAATYTPDNSSFSHYGTGNSNWEKLKANSGNVIGSLTKTTTQAMEILQLKKKDKAKHYVKAVLDKVRRGDPALLEVNLSACRLNKAKLQQFIKALRTNDIAKKLDFSNRGLAQGDALTCHLAKALLDNKSITWLDIRLNGLSLKGAKAIEELLKVNLNITRVELFEPMFRGDQEQVQKTLTSINWLLQGNYNYHAFLAGQISMLSLSGRNYKQLVMRLLENAESCLQFDISHNELEEIPDQIKMIVNVLDFRANNNQIHTIPKSFGQLKAMKKLDLSFNRLTILPDEFTALQNLEYLRLNNNQLSELPEMFRMLTKLREVDLSFNNLKKLPDELSNLELLEVLILSNNQLSDLPDSIVLLQRVKKIDVSFNLLKRLPDERPNLLYLREFLLSNNQILNLPDGIGMLPELIKLDASFNKLTRLPDEITNLAKLQELLLSNNQLACLPDFIGLMWRLKKLDLMNNKLTAIPESIQLLKYLKVIDLSQNKLKRLHEFFATLVSLDTLKLQDNEGIKGISAESLKLGDQEVIAIVQQLPKGLTKSWRTKLIVVGQGTCGKSSVVDYLMGKTDRSYRKAKGEDTKPTEGLRVLEMQVGPADQKIALSVWDFSGQEDFYLTHPLFLAPRGLYLVVFNMLDEEKADIKIENTLQLVTSKAPEAPIILVGTNADDKKVNQRFRKVFFNRIKNKFFKRFPNIKTHLAVSGKQGKHMDALMDRIVKFVFALADIGVEIPKGFIFLEDRVKVLRTVMKSPIASFKRFKDEITACGIDVQQTMMALKHLHNGGLIIYFPRTFRDFVFLDPQWVADIFSSIPRMKALVRKGFLNTEELDQVWNPAKHPPEMHNLICSMLEGFELILRPESVNDKIFVPSYLEEEDTPNQARLNELWPPGYEMEEPEFRRVYQFKFYPAGLFSRLIGRFVNNLGWELENYWKGGAILGSPGEDRAFIRLDPIDKALYVTVRGEAAGDELQNLVENSDRLIRTQMKLQAQIFVPCTHCLLLEEGKKPYLFPIEEFEDAIKEGKEYVLCKGEVAVKLRALLPNMS